MPASPNLFARGSRSWEIGYKGMIRMSASQTMLIIAYESHCALVSTQFGFVIVLSQKEAMGRHWKMVTRI